MREARVENMMEVGVVDKEGDDGVDEAKMVVEVEAGMARVEVGFHLGFHSDWNSSMRKESRR